MTEKVKLTKEQAEIIDSIKNNTNPDSVHANVRTQINKGWKGYPFKSLNELTTKQFLDALYIGYEVEKTFEIGDWVVNYVGVIGQIDRIDHFADGKRYYGKWYDGEEIVVMDCYEGIIDRHATPEEIAKGKEYIWWDNHGRGFWKLKKGDVLVNKGHGKDWLVISDINTVGGIEEYRVYPFLTGEVNFKKIEEIKEKFRIVCFAEDRKDVE